MGYNANYKRSITNIEKAVLLFEADDFTLPEIQAQLPDVRKLLITRGLMKMEDDGLIVNTKEPRNGRSIWKRTKEAYKLIKKLNQLRVREATDGGKPPASVATKAPATIKQETTKPPRQLSEKKYFEFCEKVGRINEIIKTIERDKELSAWLRYQENYKRLAM